MVGIVAIAIALTACSSDDNNGTTIIPDGDTDQADNSDTANPNTDTNSKTSVINVASFVAGALVSSDIIDCTLSNGTETQCYELVTAGTEKTTDMIGPFCPG